MSIFIKAGLWIEKKLGFKGEFNLTKYITDLIAATPPPTPTLPYKVYTALLSQSGGDSFLFLLNEPLVIGVTYKIYEDAGPSGWDFTNVGAPNNNVGTSFVATGTTPNSWTNAELEYNAGAPVAKVLENTIGNIWFTYNGVGQYYVNSNQLFTYPKSTGFIGDVSGAGENQSLASIQILGDSAFYISTVTSFIVVDDQLFDTPIEIRVYN